MRTDSFYQSKGKQTQNDWKNLSPEILRKNRSTITRILSLSLMRYGKALVFTAKIKNSIFIVIQGDAIPVNVRQIALHVVDVLFLLQYLMD